MELILIIMRKDLGNYTSNILTEIEYKKHLTLFKSILNFVMPEHINIMKTNLKDKDVLKAILEENNLEISCDRTFNRRVEPMTKSENYCISKFEDGIVECLDFIEFSYDLSELGKLKLLCNKEIINTLEEI